MKKKITMILLSFACAISTLVSVKAASENELPSELQLVELCDIDLSSEETQFISVSLPNGKTGTVIVEDVPSNNTRAQKETLTGSFNKRFTFTEASPLMTISAVYSGTVTDTSVSLNKPTSGRMSGLITFIETASEYEVRDSGLGSNIKEAVFTAQYEIVGTTHYMELILRVAPSSTTNNATLYTNGIF